MAILFHGHQDLLDRVMTEPLFSWGWNKGQDHSDPKRGRHGDSLRPGMCLVCLCSSEISSFWQQEGLIAERLIEWLNNWEMGKGRPGQQRWVWAVGEAWKHIRLQYNWPEARLCDGAAVEGRLDHRVGWMVHPRLRKLNSSLWWPESRQQDTQWSGLTGSLL